MSQHYSISRGSIVSANDGSKMQTVTVRDQYGDQATDVEHWQPAGFFSVPMPPKEGKEAEAIIGYVDGHSEHPVVLATADRRTRPTGGKPGDTGFYDPRDNRRRVSFGEDGTLNITMPAGGKVKQTIGGVSMTMSDTGFEFEGGTLKHDGKRIDAKHKHSDVMSGSGQTGFPLAVVALLLASDLVVRLIGPDAVVNVAWSVLRLVA